MSLRAVDVDDVNDLDATWSKVVAEAPQGWCWHTRRWGEFVKAAASADDAVDRTFFVFDDSGPVCLVPLAVCDTLEGPQTLRDASYNGGPLPWPCTVSGAHDANAIQKFAFMEAERRARESGAERIRFASYSPFITAGPDKWFEEITQSFNYLDLSFDSHLVTVDRHVLSHVRERYARYVRKFKAQFECTIADGAAVDGKLEQSYFELHVKDAGGQFRSRESYARIADLARFGEGFFVTARDIGSDVLVGMLLVSLIKGAAYDTSVCVEPAYQDRFVSHQLKWRAIEHLQQLGVTHYDLGTRNVSATFEDIPTAKTRGISFFKDGWARGGTKPVYVAGKFLTGSGLHKYVASRLVALEALYGFERDA